MQCPELLASITGAAFFGGLIGEGVWDIRAALDRRDRAAYRTGMLAFFGAAALAWAFWLLAVALIHRQQGGE